LRQPSIASSSPPDARTGGSLTEGSRERTAAGRVLLLYENVVCSRRGQIVPVTWSPVLVSVGGKDAAMVGCSGNSLKTGPKHPRRGCFGPVIVFFAQYQQQSWRSQECECPLLPPSLLSASSARGGKWRDGRQREGIEGGEGGQKRGWREETTHPRPSCALLAVLTILTPLTRRKVGWGLGDRLEQWDIVVCVCVCVCVCVWSDNARPPRSLRLQWVHLARRL
jgi:hypothetical protein